jgi:hypothetical protein
MTTATPAIIRDGANYVTFFQIGSPRGAATACQASSPKKNADLRVKIGAVFRPYSEIIWPLDLPCRRALRRVAIVSYHNPPLRSTPAHGIVLAWGPGRRSLVKPRGGFSGFARPAAALVLGDAYVCVSGTVPGTSSSWNPFRGRGGWRPARDSPGLRYTRKASPSCGCPRTQNGRARRPSSHRAVIPRDREAHSPPRIFFPQLACCH